MSFEYEDYFYLAQEIAGKTPSKSANEEARLRSAISRAYYAVFLKAKDYLEQYTPLIVPNDVSVHSFVREQFFARGRTDGKFARVGQNLKFLHELRNKADYGDIISELPKKIENVLQKAEDSLKRIGELR
jgi:uncharacterized protein (UPF0332 family)